MSATTLQPADKLHVDKIEGIEGPPLEPIAVVGLGCRLPGGASNPSKLWELLESGESTWSHFPGSRFNHTSFHSPGTVKIGTTNTNGGHFLKEDIAAFDATFFGITPVEARAIDPQHRLLLEIAYESFENAGLTGDQLWGSNTGVYIGQWTSDYHEIITRDTCYPATYQTTGTGSAIASNRISYYFNLKGPSFTVDTGCSASMVALHCAVQSLRNGETDRSFVAGVNLTLDPQRYTYQSRLKMFSDEGRCFSFDSRANGYGRGEGCTGVVLQTLSSALKEARPIRAVIRHTVLNQDGRTLGISVPSYVAQSAAMKKAYSEAGIDIKDVDYVEAHGTGTRVGDPIEVKAIAETLASDRDPRYPLLIGSVKGNLGHLESAAGLTGLLKAILMLERRMVPPQMNFEKINRAIPLCDWNIKIPTRLESHDLRRISVNCFGYGGTNAHVILDSAASHLPATPDTHQIDSPHKRHEYSRPRLFVLSGRSETSIKDMAQQLIKYLKKAERTEIDNMLNRLAYTLSRRQIFEIRSGVIATGPDDLIKQLEEIQCPSISTLEAKKPRQLGFVFSGQGAQYPGMGHELLDKWPFFANAIERATECLYRIGCSWNLKTELTKPANISRIEEPEVAQPLSTAIQLAIVDTLAKLGILPSLVVGHSSGEIAAAYCAKVISFDDAMTIAYHRGRLASELQKKSSDRPGAMLVIGASPDLVNSEIRKLGDAGNSIRIACFNSPSSVTISGDADAIGLLARNLSAEDIFNRKLRTGGAAYHSPQMRIIEKEYSRALETIRSGRADSSIIMVSSLTGHEIDGNLIGKEYWVENLVSPVKFTEAIKNLCQTASGPKRVELILEIGPHSQLGAPIKQTLSSLHGDAAKTPCIGTLKRGCNAEISLLETLRSLFLQGFFANIQLVNNGFHPNMPDLLTDVPSYVFDHSRTYWHESRISKAYRQRKFLPHNLLGALGGDYNAVEPTWRHFLRLEEHPWLRGHVIQSQIVFPAAGYIAMAIQAIKEHTLQQDPVAKIISYKLRNISFSHALVLSEDVGDLEMNFSLRPLIQSARKSYATWNEFRIFTASHDNTWIEHCRGHVRVELTPASENSTKAIASRLTAHLLEKTLETGKKINPKKFYFLAKDFGLDWSDPFDNMTNARILPGLAVSTVSPSTKDRGPYLIHPAVLDACLFHSFYAILVFDDSFRDAIVPTFIKQMDISAKMEDLSPRNLTCFARRKKSLFTYDIGVFDPESESKEFIFQATTVTATRLPSHTTHAERPRDLVHTIEWVTYLDVTKGAGIQNLSKQGLQRDPVISKNEQLNALALSYINQALEKISVDEIPHQHLKYWYSWMQAHPSKTEDEFPSNLSWIHDTASGQALERMGPHLAEILRGNMDPLILLTADNLLAKIYLDERCLHCYQQIASYCVEYGRQKPGMKILEIGGGTASATLPILQALKSSGIPMSYRYDFTDVSPGFFHKAGELLHEFDEVVRYQVFNADDDPVAQSFTPNSYDLIIACNVIHATSRISHTLNNIQTLLRPNGQFILMEITQNQPYYNCIFGGFSGWWAGYDDGRQSSPLLSISEWKDRLQKAGFRQTEPLFNDYEIEDGGTMSVFVVDTKGHLKSQDEVSVDIVTVSAEKFSAQALLEKFRTLLGSQEISLTDLNAPTEDYKISVLLPDVCNMLAGSWDTKQWAAFKKRILTSKAVLFVTIEEKEVSSRPDGALISGFLRTLRLEHPEIPYVSLELGSESTVENNASVIATVLQSSSFNLQPSCEDELEFRERNGQLFVPRMIPKPELSKFVHDSLGRSLPEESFFFQNDRVLTADLAIPGLLETIRWKDDREAQRPLHVDHVRIRLSAASINFKDVLIASGQLEGTVQMQNDCSGIVVEVGANMKSRYKPGDRVCALYSRSYTNYPTVHGDCCHVIPESISFEDAASLPVVWTTVYYSLVDKAGLKMGESILIHSAAGAVGQAAILLAKHIGAEIFATVGSSTKKGFLIERFGISEHHIFSSRTTAFYDGIMNATGGRGVDVVLNSLSGEIFHESCNLVAPFGRFIEIGRKDLMDDALMPMQFLLGNVTFAYVDMALVIDKAKPLAQRLLHDVIELVSSGAIGPVSTTTMPISQIENAFRLIQAGKHIGKVVLTVSEVQKVKMEPPHPRSAKFEGNATYLVVGGLGGLGKCIIQWMAENGAKSIVATSRSGLLNDENAGLIADLKCKGASLVVKKCDVGSEIQLRSLLEELPPIRGVIQSAMVLNDAIFDEMTLEQWLATISSKVQGTWNLHNLLPRTLDFFIMLSSGVAVTGNVGQSNYSAACSFQDALAHHRTRHGLTAHAINVGAVVESGYVSENPEVAVSLRRQGLGTISLSEFLMHLSHIVTRSVSSEYIISQSSLGLTPSGYEVGLGESSWMRDMKFSHVRHHFPSHGGVAGESSDFGVELRLATNSDEAIQVVCRAILNQLGKITAMPLERLSATGSLAEYGVDSLVLVELRNWIGAYLQSNVSLLMMRGSNSIQDLAKVVTKESRLIDESRKPKAS